MLQTISYSISPTMGQVEEIRGRVTGGGEGISRRLVSQVGKERSGLDVQFG